MNKKTEQFKFDYILEIILKYRWFLIIPFCLSMIVGIYLSTVLPKIYKASTLIMVQPQEVPKDYVRSIVTVGIRTRINNIAQLLKSRTNLEKLIIRFDLYSDPKYDNLHMEDKVTMLSECISIKLIRTSGKGSSGLFSVAFEGNDPEKILIVANALAEFVINENLKIRELHVLGTTQFLTEELNSIRQKLMDQENILNQYKQKYMGELPKQIDSNLKILQRLHTQLNSANENIRHINNNIADLQSTLFDTDKGKPGDSYANISQMQKKLMNLRLRYTDQHPDIIRLIKMIEHVSSSAGRETGEIGNDFRISELKSQKAGFQKKIDKLTVKIALYQKRVENTPKRELELISLQRDYDNIKKTYNSMLSRRLEAEISVNLERKQKGEQLYIIDHAKLPYKPVSPDMNRILLFCIAAGLGFGSVIIYLIEFMNNSLKTLGDIESGLNLRIFATLPTILHPRDVFIRKVNNIASIFFLIVAAVLLAGFSFLTRNGLDNTVKLINTII